MCGIVGAVAQRNIVPVLIEGLRRLEYRGYATCMTSATMPPFWPPCSSARRSGARSK
jgi:hypothetical protein